MLASPLSVVVAATKEELINQDGDAIALSLEPPSKSSAPHSDSDLSDLIAVCSGFSLGSYDISFTNLRGQGFDFLLPNWIELCGDGCGNFWVLEIPPPDLQGRTGPVWFVCHDPPAIVLVAESLPEFLDQIIDSYRRKPKLASNVFLDSWSHAMAVWRRADFGLAVEAASQTSDPSVTAICDRLGPNGLIHDTRQMKPTHGFSWEPLDTSRTVLFGNDHRVRGVHRAQSAHSTHPDTRTLNRP